MSEMPEIDPEKCDGCGICISVCTCKMLVMVDNVATYSKEHVCEGCTRWCTQCELVCPRGAITCPFEIVIEE